MKNITSISGQNDVAITNTELQITASDQSTTFVFSLGDINRNQLPTINWSIDFLGGISKTSNYNLTLVSSLDFIKDNFSKLVNAETKFTTTLNSDSTVFHYGRIKQLKRNVKNPHLLDVTVYDRFLDSAPKYPFQTLQQSYSTLHPDVLNKDWGYPVYYGKHTRPFFHTPTDCSISTLLGPRQVSSANHVNSCWFSADMRAGNQSSLDSVIRVDKFWTQENCGNSWVNTSGAYSAYGLFVRDKSTADIKLFELIDWAVTNSSFAPFTDVISYGTLLDINQGYLIAKPTTYIQGGTFELLAGRVQLGVRFSNIHRCRDMYFAWSILHYPIDYLTTLATDLVVETNTTTVLNIQAVVNTDTVIKKYNFDSNYDDIAKFGITNTNNQYLRCYVTKGNIPVSSDATFVFSMYLTATLKSVAYKNYSIYSLPVNCSDIAFSENPVQITNEILNQSSVSTLPSTASQILTNSYNFQCYFGEREDVTKIVDDIGKTTQTYYCYTSSNTMLAKTYQNSGSVSINATITTSDMLDMQLLENPLGVTRYKSQKASTIKLEYNYDFQKNRYLSSILATPYNNSNCESAFASGIEKSMTKRTKYIMEDTTAGYYLNTLVKKYTSSEAFVNLKLPARYFALELTDVIKVEHPILQNSASLFQITTVKQNFNTGLIDITAQELIDV